MRPMPPVQKRWSRRTIDCIERQNVWEVLNVQFKLRKKWRCATACADARHQRCGRRLALFWHEVCGRPRAYLSAHAFGGVTEALVRRKKEVRTLELKSVIHWG